MEAEETMQESENSLFCKLHPAQSLVGICSVCLQEKLGKLVFTERESLFQPQSRQQSESETLKRHDERNLPDGVAGPCNGRSKVLLGKSKSVATSSRRVVALQDSANHGPNKKKASSSSASSSSSSSAAAIWSFFSFGKKKHQSESRCGQADKRDVDGEVCGRLVTRSRSVGFGSRSFSSAEIYQKAEPIVVGKKEELENENERQGNDHGSVRCGGLFVGFGGMAVSGSDDDGCEKASSGCHSRSKSWGWAFSSPLRAFIHSSKRWTNKDAAASSSSLANASASSSATANADSALPGSLLEIDRG
eukprot:TRINITY_DN5838_c0_g2_i1.p1 TRINITY_DN5838_c0_g2~~TRINITY_DN5838_c0_g2_i1.p1  ORF type:complete len:305 (+),score=103.76 TRINITY_DN5838_c0_g2_i1:678-1592(+)